MSAAHDYPKRPKFFSHRFCRVLAKACAANEIGPDACWLLTVIAHTEDAKGYRDAVTFFNGQLQAFVGCGSDDSLNRMRTKAVRSGWLHYEPGGKGKAGRYWVVIPEQHRDWDDLPSDESSDCDANSPAQVRGEAGGKCGKNPGESAGEAVSTRTVADTSRGKVRGEPRDKPGESADHSSLSLSLSLSQDPPTPRGAGGDAGDYAAVPATGDESDPGPERDGRGSRRLAVPPPPGGFDPTAAEPDIVRLDEFDALLAEWTAAKLPGHDAPQGIQGTSQRRGLWQQRLAAPHWRANWREAVRRAGRSAACRGANPKFMAQGLRIDTFLRDADTLTRILEGNYDDPAPSATGPPAGADVVARARANLERQGIKPLAYPPRTTKPPGAA